jgi:hypothetical protein
MVKADFRLLSRVVLKRLISDRRGATGRVGPLLKAGNRLNGAPMDKFAIYDSSRIRVTPFG